KSATSGLPSAAATCIGPVSFVIIKSQRRIHSIISGNDVSPHKFKMRFGSAAEIFSPSDLSSALPRIAKRASGNFCASNLTSAEKFSTGQRLLFQRAPGCKTINCELQIADCGFNFDLKIDSTFV